MIIVPNRCTKRDDVLACMFGLAFATPTYGQNASLIFTDEDSKVLKTEMLAKADKDVYVFLLRTLGKVSKIQLC